MAKKKTKKTNKPKKTVKNKKLEIASSAFSYRGIEIGKKEAIKEGFDGRTLKVYTATQAKNAGLIKSDRGKANWLIYGKRKAKRRSRK